MQPITLLLSTFLTAGGTPPAPDVAIVGARIEIGDGRVVERGTIVVHGDKILSVGAGPAPAGATVVDGNGLTVYPGFIDAYSTSGLKLPEPIPSGKDVPDTVNTAPATMWHQNRKNIRADVRAADCLDLKGPFTERYAQGVTSVLLSGGNGSLAGTAALVDLADAPKVVNAEAAGEIVLRGGGGRGGGGADTADMAGGQGRRPQADDGAPTYAYPGTLFGIYGLMRQTLADAKGYAAQDKPKADPTYEGLKPLVTGQMPCLFTLTNARDIARAGHVADEFGLRMIVNGGTDGYRMIDVLKAHGASVVLSLDQAAEPRRTPSTEADSIPQRVLDDRYATYQERLGNAKALDAAGIVLAFRSGSDGYLAGVRKMIANGLPRAAALRAMTVNPAAMFGAADRLGTIEAGKTANLVIMTGDFADAKSKVQSVLVEGARFETEKSK